MLRVVKTFLCGCTYCVDVWREALIISHLLTPPHTSGHFFLKNSSRIVPPLFLQHKQKLNHLILLLGQSLLHKTHRSTADRCYP